MVKALDLTDQRINMLTVLKRQGSKGGKTTWLCRCDCGNVKILVGTELSRGKPFSCGCTWRDLLSKSRIKHGCSIGKGTPEFRAWQNMRERCYTETHQAYPNYGGRGIKVCDRWRGSFENFFEDMGTRPSPKHSLDRKDNNGDYEPGELSVGNARRAE